jgi:hypothetical protein
MMTDNSIPSAPHCTGMINPQRAMFNPLGPSAPETASMSHTSYVYDSNANPTVDSLRSTTYSYTWGAESPAKDTPAAADDHAGPDGPAQVDAAPSLGDEQLALLDLLASAERRLSRQRQRALEQVIVDPAAWPLVKVATDALLLQLAYQFLEHLGIPTDAKPTAIIPPAPQAEEGQDQKEARPAGD